MKDKSKKHDHKGTKLLKLSIFFTIMLAPILAIAFKCAYVTFNKNAYQSYSDSTYVESKIDIQNTANATDGQVLNFVYIDNEITSTSNTGEIPFTSLSFDPTDYGFDDLPYVSISISSRTNANYIMLYTSNSYAFKDIWGTELKSFSLVLNNASLNRQTTNISTKCFVYTYQPEKLDRAFYYAIDEMQESTLFNWTENTAIYTPIQAMTSGLGITTDAIAIMLTYWMYITLIYIVFDIVIELFTYLTHTLMGQPM